MAISSMGQTRKLFLLVCLYALQNKKTGLASRFLVAKIEIPDRSSGGKSRFALVPLPSALDSVAW